jgi:hypothetical protein
MLLGFRRDGKNVALLTKGLCAPEAVAGISSETWHVTDMKELTPGDYAIEALFIDNSKRAWFEATGGSDAESAFLAPPVPLGHIKVQ